jgi:flagellar hook-associated protein 2
VFYGGDDPEDALLVTSKTNTLDALIPGVTIDLLSTSDSPIQITVNEDREAITSAVSDFVSSFNGLIDKMNEHDSYNADTEERGLLLGDPTLARLRSAIYNAVIGSNGDLTGRYDSLSEIGVTVGSGAKLRFDQAKFTEALNTDPEAVRDLFTFEQFEVDAETGEDTDVVAAQGVGLEIQKLLADLTDSIDGPVQRQVDIIQSQIDANEGRVERLEETIEDKRARLEREFANLELTLAGLQDSNTALNSLNPVQAPQQ